LAVTAALRDKIAACGALRLDRLQARPPIHLLGAEDNAVRAGLKKYFLQAWQFSGLLLALYR
jgi:hypothetical protein